MLKNTYVIVPVFNEESVIGGVINELKKSFSHIICVDDGSTDQSVEVIKKTGVTLLRHECNHGQGAALRTGINFALTQKSAKYFLTFDADGQHRVQDALRLVERLKRDKLDIVLGSRFLGSTENMSYLKHMVLKLAVIFMNHTTGVKLTDTHNGLRAFNRSFAEKLRLRTNGMAHASEFIYRIKTGGYSYGEVPVTIRYTNYSKAKGQSIFNAFSILWELRKV